MAKNILIGLIGLTALLSAHTAVASETTVSGFASMVGGIVTQGDQYLADYPNTGLYDDALSFSPDTSFGVQLKTKLNPQSEFIIQALSHGAHGFDIDIDWAYLNISLDSEFSLQAGRKRLPLYYYSDFFSLGFAYYWMRPPSDNYTWQITNYNGVSLFYEPDFLNWDALFNIYIGREDDEHNKLLTLLLEGNNTTVSESWKNIIGFVAELSDDTFDYRFTIMSSELTRHHNDLVQSDGVRQLFYGLSINARFDNAIILSELNRYTRAADDIDVTTYMLSLGYKINSKTTPHITYSELQQSHIPLGDEHHYTYSLGVRHDLNKKMALKLQYDITTDKAVDSPIVGDGELLSFGLDIVF